MTGINQIRLNLCLYEIEGEKDRFESDLAPLISGKSIMSVQFRKLCLHISF